MRPPADRPNVLLVNCDDLGYGDLSSYGHPYIRTPHLDRLAAEGVRYVNRGALLTGNYPNRSGLYGRTLNVLFPGDPFGIPAETVTMAEVLGAAGYRTAIIGKWHLGDAPDALPTRHGFDYWYGLPYSNDMGGSGGAGSPPPLPLVRGERLADLGSGGGLPGVPLAIADPALSVTLIEPRVKRAAFLAHVARHLGLANVKVERCRAAELPPDAGFDTVVTRAFGTLSEFVAAAGGLCRPGGCLLAAKGRHPGAELDALASDWRAEVVALTVPGVDGPRHAVRLEPRGVEEE